MSRSAFDVLMAKNKSQLQSSKSSPQKRKTPAKSQTCNSRIEETVENSSSHPIFDANVENAVKKVKLSISPDDSVMELKKKAAVFEAKRAAYWGEGERVPFTFIAKALDAVSEETGMIVITEIVCNMLRAVMETTPDDLFPVISLLANDGLALGVGEDSIIEALAEASGAGKKHIEKQKKEVHGDLGLVAKHCRFSQSLLRKPARLTVAKVFDTFGVIAKESGTGKKKNHIKALLVAATDCERLYLIRLLQKKMRIGSGEQTLLSALGHAAVYSEKKSSPAKAANSLEDAAKILKEVHSVTPLDAIIPALLSGGVWDLPMTCGFSLGTPVGPMLANPTKGPISKIVENFQGVEFTCEYKYDGERAQIHYMENGSVEIFSRNDKRSTGKFPDVVASVTRFKKPCATSFVLDCELVAYDREKQEILPFQVLSTRARKNVDMKEIKVHVCIFAFDILYLNGQPLLKEQLNVRREHLYRSFQEETGFFQFVTAITSNDVEEIKQFFNDAVDSRSEGLMIKTLKKDATYEPSKRSHNWLKLKKDYVIGDSLDLVPIAAFYGKGKRTGVYGAFLLACYDDDKKEFQSICNVGTGFSEAMLEEIFSSLGSKVITKPESYYKNSDTISPDVWFEPSEVWEVQAAGFTISSDHRAAFGTVNPDKGISLRFPRFVRVPEDKNPEHATSSDMVAALYNAF